MPLLQVKNLSVTLGDQHILHNISFDMDKKEVLAIIGPNGAGKSVLLKTLIGLINPTSGTITWQKNIKIGYLPQRFHVDYYLPMTVKEFLLLKFHPKYSIPEVAEVTKIEKSWLGKNLAHLSSGQLQKVLLAWAIMENPDVLLCDEPTENVDVVNQDSIYKLLHELEEKMNMGIIIVSHDLHVVYVNADRVICLNQKMICYGDPHEALSTENLSQLYKDHTFFNHHHHQNQKSDDLKPNA